MQVVISAHVPAPVSSAQPDQGADGNAPSFCALASSPSDVLSRQTREAGLFSTQSSAEAIYLPAETNCVTDRGASTPCVGQPRASLAPVSGKRSPHKTLALTIEQAIQGYLEDRRSHHRRPKTLQWHRHALEVFQRYLQSRHHCLLLDQITEVQVRGWLVFLSQTPGARGSLRSSSTVESYARSARAFCQWLMRHRYLQASPFARLALPKPETRVLHPLAPEEWDQMLLACRPTRKIAVLAERATVRNRAILWLLFDTGMRVSELCELRLSDVDREQGTLLIRGKGARIRLLTLGHEGLRHLRAYLDTYRQEETARVEQRSASQDHLFLSETGHPLTENGISLLFGRLRKRAGIVRGAVNPSLLRESFALRYLQTGGEPSILQELLGYPNQATSTRYQCLIARVLAQQQWKGSP